MNPVDITESRCPHCGSKFSNGVSTSDDPPQAGMPAICVSCGGWLQLDDNLAFIRADAETSAKMDMNPLALITRKIILDKRAEKVILN